jgi:hypothetical protein
VSGWRPGGVGGHDGPVEGVQGLLQGAYALGDRLVGGDGVHGCAQAVGGDLLARQVAAQSQLLDAQGVGALLVHLRHGDHGHAVVEGLHGAVHAGVGEEDAGVAQHVELRHVAADVEVGRNLSQLGGVDVVADGHDHVPVGVAERPQCQGEELRPAGGGGAQGDQQDGPVGRLRLPGALEGGAVLDAGAGEDEALVEGIALVVELARQEDDAGLGHVGDEGAHVAGESEGGQQGGEPLDHLQDLGVVRGGPGELLGDVEGLADAVGGEEAHGGQVVLGGVEAGAPGHEVVDDDVRAVLAVVAADLLVQGDGLLEAAQALAGHRLLVVGAAVELAERRLVDDGRGACGLDGRDEELRGRAGHPVAPLHQFLDHPEGRVDVADGREVEEGDVSHVSPCSVLLGGWWRGWVMSCQV